MIGQPQQAVFLRQGDQNDPRCRHIFPGSGTRVVQNANGRHREGEFVFLKRFRADQFSWLAGRHNG